MRSSGRIVLGAVLPLFLLLTACTDPVINIEDPEEVDSCDVLTIVGIELVNDYVYTMEALDLGVTGGDPAKLPSELVTLNRRGEELDDRIVELDCDAVAINRAIAEATAGIESDDPVVAAFLESVRGGIVAPILPMYGEWILESGTVGGESIAAAADNPITLIIERESASGFAGCNGYFYPVSLADGIWARSEGTATVTDRLCNEGGGEGVDVMATEEAYVAALEQVVTYSLIDEMLVLSGDGVELRFVRSRDGEG